MSVQGPYKHEVLSLTAVTNADEVEANMVSPLFAVFIPTENGMTVDDAVNIGVSGRTLTINSGNLTDTTGVMLVWGT
jgi:hypothetical protein